MELVTKFAAWWVGRAFDCNSCQKTYKLTPEDKNQVKVPWWGGCREIRVTCLCGKTALFNDGF